MKSIMKLLMLRDPLIDYMEYIVIGAGIILFIGGIIGCFLPVLPGPGLCYLGLLCLQLRTNPPCSSQ